MRNGVVMGSTGVERGDGNSLRLDDSACVNSTPRFKRKRPTSSSRGVANLTPEQLARKRQNDREAQRAIRERTKSQIESLSARIRELEAQQPSTDLQMVLQQKEAIQAENEEIRRRMASVMAMLQPFLGVSSHTHSLHSDHHSSHNGFPDSSIQNLLMSSNIPFVLSPESKQISSKWAATHSSISDSTHSVKNLISHEKNFHHVWDRKDKNQFPEIPDSMLYNHMIKENNVFRSKDGNNSENRESSQNPINNLPAAPGVTGTAGVATGILSETAPTKHFSIFSPCSNDTGSGIMTLTTVRAPACALQRLPSPFGYTILPQTFEVCTLDTLLIDFLKNRARMAKAGVSQERLLGPPYPNYNPIVELHTRCLDSSIKSEKNSSSSFRDNVSFSASNTKCGNIVDVSAQVNSQNPRTTMCDLPRVGSIACAENSDGNNCNSKPHALSRVFTDIIRTFPNFKDLPEQIAVVYAMFLITRWKVLPTKEHYERMPEWIRPQPSQLLNPHPTWMDLVPWPQLRNRLVQSHPFVTIDDFFPSYTITLSLNWPYDHHSCLIPIHGPSCCAKEKSASLPIMKSIPMVSVNPATAIGSQTMLNPTQTNSFGTLTTNASPIETRDISNTTKTEISTVPLSNLTPSIDASIRRPESYFPFSSTHILKKKRSRPESVESGPGSIQTSTRFCTGCMECESDLQNVSSQQPVHCSQGNQHTGNIQQLGHLCPSHARSTPQHCHQVQNQYQQCQQQIQASKCTTTNLFPNMDNFLSKNRRKGANFNKADDLCSLNCDTSFSGGGQSNPLLCVVEPAAQTMCKLSRRKILSCSSPELKLSLQHSSGMMSPVEKNKTNFAKNSVIAADSESEDMAKKSLSGTRSLPTQSPREILSTNKMETRSIIVSSMGVTPTLTQTPASFSIASLTPISPRIIAPNSSPNHTATPTPTEVKLPGMISHQSGPVSSGNKKKQGILGGTTSLSTPSECKANTSEMVYGENSDSMKISECALDSISVKSFSPASLDLNPNVVIDSVTENSKVDENLFISKSPTDDPESSIRNGMVDIPLIGMMTPSSSFLNATDYKYFTPNGDSTNNHIHPHDGQHQQKNKKFRKLKGNVDRSGVANAVDDDIVCRSQYKENDVIKQESVEILNSVDLPISIGPNTDPSHVRMSVQKPYSGPVPGSLPIGILQTSSQTVPLQSVDPNPSQTGLHASSCADETRGLLSAASSQQFMSVATKTVLSPQEQVLPCSDFCTDETVPLPQVQNHMHHEQTSTQSLRSADTQDQNRAHAQGPSRSHQQLSQVRSRTPTCPRCKSNPVFYIDNEDEAIAQGSWMISPEFEAHLRDLNNWSLGSMFRDAFPEFADTIRIRD